MPTLDVRRTRLVNRCRSVTALNCVALAVMALASIGGCAKVSRWTIDPWLTDYDTVERRAQEQHRPMIIVFRDGRREIDDPLEKRIRASGVAREHANALRATLYQSYEPDRRYVAQFGVERAPAVIVVHADGTYHSISGTLTGEQLQAFATTAKPPGETPTRNPLVPRRIEYDWYATLPGADEAVRRTGKPLLVVVTRAATRDWDSLHAMLDRPEVHRRVRDMIHCHIDTWNPFASSWSSRWGKLDLPAIVIEQPDGTHRVIEKPVGYEPIVRFLDAYENAGTGEPGSNADAQ